MTKKMVALNMSEDDDILLKSKGINRSKFMAQAVEAYRKKIFEYEYL